MENFEITKSELFRHPKFGNLRVLTDEKGEPWFVGKLIFKDYSKTLLSKLWQGKDFKPKIIINESGLYSLILGSKLPAAIEFKHWVTSEVLPQIRRTGGYIPTHDDKGKPLTDLEIMSLAFQIHERTIAERDRKIAEQDETIRVLEPKAEYCDEVLESVNCMTMTQVAKEHGTTHPALTKLLHEKGVLFMQSGQWMLYADYGNHGLTRNRTHSYHDSEGVTHSHSYLVWTEKGRMFLDGILRRRLSPKEALRQVEHARQPHVQRVVQLEINL